MTSLFCPKLLAMILFEFALGAWYVICYSHGVSLFYEDWAEYTSFGAFGLFLVLCLIIAGIICAFAKPGSTIDQHGFLLTTVFGTAGMAGGLSRVPVDSPVAKVLIVFGGICGGSLHLLTQWAFHRARRGSPDEQRRHRATQR